MTKNDRAQKNGDDAKSKGHGRSQNFKSATSQSKATLKIKRTNRNKHMIEASFKNCEGNDVKEMIYTFRDGDPPELLIDLEKQLLKLGDRYDLFETGKWKTLGQIGGRALEGRCEQYWHDIVETARNHNAGDSDAQRKKFKKLIQKVNTKYLGKDAIEDQREAMEFGELKYDGHDHTAAVEQLFEINDNLELLGEDVSKFSIREMAKRIIPKNLKTSANLKYYDKCGDNLRDKEDIIELCRRISTMLKREADANRDNREHRNSNRSRSNNTNSNDAREGRDAAPCRKHDGAHLWKDCPDNWKNKNRNNDSARNSASSPSPPSQNSSRKNRGEVKSTESRSTNESPMIRFDSDYESDDESACSSHASRGELMEIVTKSDAKSQHLHPITIITLLDNDQKRVACKALLDQCCTDKGLISWDMAKMLDLPTTTGPPKIFATANGTFSSNEALKLDNAMLPCLSTNRSFTIELMVIPKECCVDMNYGIIIGQESMRLLDLDTSVRDNTISWGDCEVNMVPRDYWTTERILQQKSRLLKQPKPVNHDEMQIDTTQAPNEVFVSEALVAVSYKKADLNAIAQNCNALNKEQKAMLLSVLMKHEPLFQGTRGNWKGKPVSIEVVDGATPVWSKPYPTPLRNRDTFKEEVYRQCSIGALRELSASEIEEREWASPCFGIPKKDGSIRLVMDFRKLNSVLKRKEYPLQTIDKMFQNIRRFTFASVIGLNMGYLSIPL